MTNAPIPLTTRRPRSGLSRYADHALTIAAALGVASLLAALLFAATGVTPLIFRSASMSPAISTGSLALARSVHTSQLAVGDVVSVHDAQGVRVTHRIVALGAGQLFLKGDANATPDAMPYPVSSADRVFFSAPYVGSVVSAVMNPIGRGLLLVAVALIALALIRPRRDRSTPGGPPPSPPVSRGKERVAVVAALVMVAGVGVGIARAPQGTSAFWTDSVQADSTITIGAAVDPAIVCVQSNGSVTLSWPAVAGATSYRIQIFEWDDGEWDEEEVRTQSGTSVTVSGENGNGVMKVDNGNETFRVVVTARNGGGATLFTYTGSIKIHGNATRCVG